MRPEDAKKQSSTKWTVVPTNPDICRQLYPRVISYHTTKDLSGFIPDYGPVPSGTFNAIA